MSLKCELCITRQHQTHNTTLGNAKVHLVPLAEAAIHKHMVRTPFQELHLSGQHRSTSSKVLQCVQQTVVDLIICC